MCTVSACRLEGDGQKPLAFPGAQGSGKYTTGGRHGRVLMVTNCDDQGRGSLRWALSQSGARTVLFKVSGYIDLATPITIEHGNVTIAGQSAPGDGICLRGNGLVIASSNVIIRYLRIRPGDKISAESDAISAVGVQNIIIDHCSFSWATDELCALYGCKNVTLQNCILSESLNNQTHPTRQQSSGAVWGGNPATFHHNLLAHNKSRNPRIWGTFQADTLMPSCIEISNNIFYNWSDKCMYGGEGGQSKITHNIFIPGPVLHIARFPILLHPLKPFGKFCLENNTVEGFKQLTHDNTKGVLLCENTQQDFLATLVDNIQVSDYAACNASTAMAEILETVGASFCRDEVDKRILADLQRRSAAYGVRGIITSQDEVGGWPQLLPGDVPTDTDADGLPDSWEISHGLNPQKYQDALNVSLDTNYTNIELYLNQLCQLKQ